MLPLRALSRSTRHLSGIPLKPTRTSSITPLSRGLSELKFQVPPRTISQRLWYRRDGTPRSKIRGLAIATLSGSLLALIYTLADLITDLELTAVSLVVLLHVQRVSHKFPLSDVSSYDESIAYLWELFRPFLETEHGKPPDDLTVLHVAFNKFFTEELPQDSREDLHAMIKDTSAQIKEALERYDETEEAVNAAEDVQEILGKAVQELRRYTFGNLVRNLDRVIVGKKEKKDKDKDEDYELVG